MQPEIVEFKTATSDTEVTWALTAKREDGTWWALHGTPVYLSDGHLRQALVRLKAAGRDQQKLLIPRPTL